MNKVLVSIVALAVLGAVVPTVDSQEESILPEPLPLSLDTNTFHILSVLSVTGATDKGCPEYVRGMWGAASSTSALLYAINNADDPCQVDPAEATPSRHALAMDLNDARWRIHVVPRMAEGTPLVEGDDIVVSFTIAIMPQFGPVPVSYGSIQPKVTLTSGDAVIGTWDEAEPVGPATLQGPTQGEIYVPYEVKFPAPATLNEGVVNLTVDVSNDPAAQELRRVHSRLGFAIDDEHRGSITFPFAANIETFGNSGGSGDGGDSDNGTENETGNQTGNTTGNETVPDNTTAPEPTNTTAPSNNTTGEVPDEQGFLPGFELAAVVSAGLIAMAYVARERRRPPMAPRS